MFKFLAQQISFGYEQWFVSYKNFQGGVTFGLPPCMYLFLGSPNDNSDISFCQSPRKKEKSVGAQVLKLTPKYLKFAFYCIFTLQFFKTCGGPGPHGPHGYEGPGCKLTYYALISIKLLKQLLPIQKQDIHDQYFGYAQQFRGLIEREPVNNIIITNFLVVVMWRHLKIDA